MYPIFKLMGIILLVAAITTACTGSNTGSKPTTEGMTVSGSPSTPIQVQLSMPFAPLVNQDVPIKLVISTVEAASNIEAVIETSDGVVIVSGDTQKQFNLEAGASTSIEAVIRFTQAGQFEINGRALSDIAPGTVWGDMATIYITVGETASQFGFETITGEAAGLGEGGSEGSGNGLSATPVNCASPQGNVPGCVPPEIIASECPPPSSEPATPVSIAIKPPETLKAGEIIQLGLVVCSHEDAPRTQVTLELPSGVEIVNGALFWEVDLLADQPAGYSISVRFQQAGAYTVAGTALYNLAEGTTWGDRVEILLVVGE